eukprot:jgi/Bigna1/138952/aug1.47_g13660
MPEWLRWTFIACLILSFLVTPYSSWKKKKATSGRKAYDDERLRSDLFNDMIGYGKLYYPKLVKEYFDFHSGPNSRKFKLFWEFMQYDLHKKIVARMHDRKELIAKSLHNVQDSMLWLRHYAKQIKSDFGMIFLVQIPTLVTLIYSMSELDVKDIVNPLFRTLFAVTAVSLGANLVKVAELLFTVSETEGVFEQQIYHIAMDILKNQAYWQKSAFDGYIVQENDAKVKEGEMVLSSAQLREIKESHTQIVFNAKRIPINEESEFNPETNNEKDGHHPGRDGRKEDAAVAPKILVEFRVNDNDEEKKEALESKVFVEAIDQELHDHAEINIYVSDDTYVEDIQTMSEGDDDNVHNIEIDEWSSDESESSGTEAIEHERSPQDRKNEVKIMEEAINLEEDLRGNEIARASSSDEIIGGSGPDTHHSSSRSQSQREQDQEQEQADSSSKFVKDEILPNLPQRRSMLSSNDPTDKKIIKHLPRASRDIRSLHPFRSSGGDSEQGREKVTAQNNSVHKGDKLVSAEIDQKKVDRQENRFEVDGDSSSSFDEDGIDDI